MGLASAVVLFSLSLLLVTVASFVLTGGLQTMARRLSFSGGLLGLVVALAGDAPEMSSAIAALARGHHDLGLTVILGSNVFNIAGILGIVAMIGKGIQVDTRYLLANGAVSTLLAGLVMLVILRLVPDPVGLALLLLVLAPYVAIISLRTETVQRLPLPAVLGTAVQALASDADTSAADAQKVPGRARNAWIALLPALGAIVLGSVGLVHSAVQLGERWGIPHVVIGTFILAILTGIPNLIAAVQLAQTGRGAAAIGEALNSNSLNLVVSIGIPALFTELPQPAPHTVLAGWWLVAITGSLVLFALWGGTLDRSKGGILLLLYAAFVVWFMVL